MFCFFLVFEALSLLSDEDPAFVLVLTLVIFCCTMLLSIVFLVRFEC